MLNDQFKEIFYRWKFLWGFRKHQCCFCCCCCCFHFFLVLFTPWPATYFLICCVWKNDFFVLEFVRKSEISRKYPFSDDVRRGDVEPLRRPQDRFSFSWKCCSCFSQKMSLLMKYCFIFIGLFKLSIFSSQCLYWSYSLQGFTLPFKNLDTYVCRRTHRRRNPWSPLVS